MRHTKTWISLLLAQLVWIGSSHAESPAPADKMWRVLEAGAAHVQAVGTEQALRDFADPNGKWQRDGVHVSVVGTDGTIVVDGQGQARAGSSVDNLKDSTGRTFGADLVSQVKEWGHGGIEYAVVNPQTGKGEYRTMYATVLPRSAGILAVGATPNPSAGYRSDK
ncbi:MAG TPA: cache domain-containing protein [Burkholderiaceae bacterium]